MIGVFDSGLGGLSVLAAIAHAIPEADLAYFADTGHIPYGAKSDDFIRARVQAIGDHLADIGCDIIVVACNTATAAAVEGLRKRHPGIPVVGIEPGVKPAAAASATRRIAVLATESTARSERLAQLIRNHASGVHVHVEPCPGWATRVEMLHLDHPEFLAEIGDKIQPLLDDGIDQLVLGCTHYSFLAPQLRQAAQGRANLVDVADAVARQVGRLVSPAVTSTSPLVTPKRSGAGTLKLLASADPEHLSRALPKLGLTALATRAGKPLLRHL